MPLDYTSRNIQAGATSPYIPLITNNPAFQVKIVAMDGKLEAKPNVKDDKEQQMAIKIGDTIRGEVISKTRKKGENVLGKVLQVVLDDGEVTAYKVITKRGKEVMVDPTTAAKIEINGQKQIASIDTTNPTLENRIMLYEEWKYNQQINR
jgi:hypothetical protein